MLHHPNIIEYHDSFVADRAMAIVMKYASGGNLYDYLEERAREERWGRLHRVTYFSPI